MATKHTQLCLKVRGKSDGRNTADQLLDSATSVGANYGSACRGRSRAEFIAKLGVVVEEIEEAVYWLEFTAKSGLVSENDVTALLDEARQLRAIFASSYRTARANHLQSNSKRKR